MKRTTFYNIHKKLGAKLVEFAGFEMPIQYSSIISEHKSIRNSVGVFDVSHMGEVFVKGEKALDFIQYIAINDASKLQTGRVQYSAMCYKDGGIVDDLLIYKIADDEFLLVINASNIEKDFKWMQENNQFGVELRNESDDYSLLAVQGPNSLNTLQKLTDTQINMEYYHFTNLKLAGVDMVLSRTGYTGEVGYELYFKGDEKTAEELWNKIFEAGKEFNIQPAGLAARDTLRLEMGFCLYGNDIDQTTNPLEAGLGWITKLSKQNFIGKDALVKIKENGLKRKLVAITSDEKTFPRHGYDISVNNKKIGTVTSGTVSPMLDKPIALGYVETEFSEIETDVNFLIRGKEIPAKVVKLPFVKKIIIDMKLNVFLSSVIVDELYFTGKTTVVIDVLRATSTIATAINNSAKEIIPVASVEFAVKVSGGIFGGQTLLGGERNTKKIEGFALGNSPFEYTKEVVEGKSIILFTTNGSKAIVKTRYSENLFTCSFINIDAVADHLKMFNTDIEIICAGRNNFLSIEDSVCAGMLISKIKEVRKDISLNDSGTAVLALYDKYKNNLVKMMRESDHGKILLENGFEADLEYCGQIGILNIIPSYSNGVLKKLKVD